NADASDRGHAETRSWTLNTRRSQVVAATTIVTNLFLVLEEVDRLVPCTCRSIGTERRWNWRSSPVSRMLPARRAPLRRWRFASRGGTLRLRCSRRALGSAGATILSAQCPGRSYMRLFA